MYHTTGRGLLVSAGVLSMTALLAGMWLFTFAAPYFYWFGAPTAFIMGYLLLSCAYTETWRACREIERKIPQSSIASSYLLRACSSC